MAFLSGLFNKKPSDKPVKPVTPMEEFFVYDVNSEGCIWPPSKAMQMIRNMEIMGEELVQYSIFNSDEPDKKIVQQKIFNDGFTDVAEDRAIGAVLGMAIGDALGAPLEFKPVRYGIIDMKGMDALPSGFGLKPGQWTDDCSMGLCLADSLLIHPQFNPADLKHRFYLWWNCGYNNAFRFDKNRLSKHSVGLGGNIGGSFVEFGRTGIPYTKSGDKNTSGNGCIMRMSPAPVCYHDNHDKALEVAKLQSLTTHQGEEAADCSRLMAHIIVTAIHSGDGTNKILNQIEFQTDLKSVHCLAESVQEDETPGKDWKLEDRNWNWKDPNFRYSPQRASMQPGYVGSYCMDALAMALHCIWTTNTFEEALLKSANTCGDADSVSSVTGQMAGAIYGVSSIPKDWISKVQQWDNGGEIAMRGYKLFHHLK